MLDTDFTDADLSGALFFHCELTDARFLHSKLERADFRTAAGFQIDPEQNRMKGARFSREGLTGLLSKYELNIE